MKFISTKLLEMGKKKKIIWLITGLIGSVVCQILFAGYNDDMISRGYDIIDFEFAWTVSTMDSILDAWSDILPDMINFMVVDMFFPIFYFMILSGWTILVAQGNKYGSYAVFAALLASIFDYIENIASFYVLQNPNNFGIIWVLTISVFASMKFILLIAVILTNLVVSNKNN